jgi:hypothetical protein
VTYTYLNPQLTTCIQHKHIAAACMLIQARAATGMLKTIVLCIIKCSSQSAVTTQYSPAVSQSMMADMHVCLHRRAAAQILVVPAADGAAPFDCCSKCAEEA